MKEIHIEDLLSDISNKKNEINNDENDDNKDNHKEKKTEEKKDLKILKSKKVIPDLTTINLNKINLTKIEKFFFTNLPNLININLSNNKIKKLSKNFFALKHLKILNLENNYIEYIPDNIDLLNSIKELNFSINQIKNLPKTIKNLENLEILKFSNNKINIIPIEIGDINSLKVLHFDSNYFTEIPTTICYLKNLIEISLDWFEFLDPQYPKILKDSIGKKFINLFLNFLWEMLKNKEKDFCQFVNFIEMQLSLVSSSSKSVSKQIDKSDIIILNNNFNNNNHNNNVNDYETIKNNLDFNYIKEANEIKNNENKNKEKNKNFKSIEYFLYDIESNCKFNSKDNSDGKDSNNSNSKEIYIENVYIPHLSIPSEKIDLEKKEYFQYEKNPLKNFMKNYPKKIFYAIEQNYYGVIKSFEEFFPELNLIKNNNNMTPFYYSIHFHKKEMTDLFLSKLNLSQIINPSIYLFKAVKILDENLLIKLLNMGMNTNLKEENGWNLFHYLFVDFNKQSEKSIRICDLLIDYCEIDVYNKLNNEGWAPIHIASRNTSADCVKYIIEKNKKIIEDNNNNIDKNNKIPFEINIKVNI
jgi:hypothetical protein